MTQPTGDNRILPWLRLVRLPTVFTAMADVLAGFLMTSGTMSFQPTTAFCGLLVASVCLYWSGMVFNDVFDLKQDTAERPTRPIPAGAISRRAAIVFGAFLIIAGNGAAWAVSSSSGIIAGCLTLAILSYDSVLKRTFLGPVAMGSCRFFNVMLAGSSAVAWQQLWQAPQLVFAAGLGIYVAGLTWFARNEAATSQRGQLTAAAIVSLIGVGVLAALPVMHPGVVSASSTQLALLVIAVVIGRRLFDAIRNPDGRTIRGAIKTMLLSIVTMDATMIYFKTGNVNYAIIAVALIIPAMVLSKRIAMT